MASHADRTVLRELAKKVEEIAHQPVQTDRIREWKRHNDKKPGRPMILVFPEGSWHELLPDTMLVCEGDAARRYEWELLHRIYQHEHFDCDNVVTDELVVPKAIRSSGFGLAAKWRFTDDRVHGARGFDPVLFGMDDIARIHPPSIEHDEAESLARLASAQETFGDLLRVRLGGVAHVSFHLMAQYTELRGLQPMMEDLVEQPELVHAAMDKLTQAHASVIDQYDRLGLLEGNADGTYHSSGGVGFTDALPHGVPARPKEMWASAESQELALVSPAMHKEFALDYEKQLLAPFARAGYGCCESLSHKIRDVLTLPNLWRVSISPFADVDVAARGLLDRAILSWKPHPAHLVGGFDEDRIRAYVRHTVQAAKQHGCLLEIILKDTHTCEGRPERFTRWTRIARDVVNRAECS
jgi:hypothetical protein